MAIEIERKYLVRDDSWRQGTLRSVLIQQGYFCRTPLLRAHIRIFGDKGYITLKSEPGKLTRYEF
jgi:adenylate cyclase